MNVYEYNINDKLIGMKFLNDNKLASSSILLYHTLNCIKNINKDNITFFFINCDDNHKRHKPPVPRVQLINSNFLHKAIIKISFENETRLYDRYKCLCIDGKENNINFIYYLHLSIVKKNINILNIKSPYQKDYFKVQWKPVNRLLRNVYYRFIYKGLKNKINNNYSSNIRKFLKIKKEEGKNQTILNSRVIFCVLTKIILLSLLSIKSVLLRIFDNKLSTLNIHHDKPSIFIIHTQDVFTVTLLHLIFRQLLIDKDKQDPLSSYNDITDNNQFFLNLFYRSKQKCMNDILLQDKFQNILQYLELINKNVLRNIMEDIIILPHIGTLATLYIAQMNHFNTSMKVYEAIKKKYNSNFLSLLDGIGNKKNKIIIIIRDYPNHPIKFNFTSLERAYIKKDESKNQINNLFFQNIPKIDYILEKIYPSMKNDPIIYKKKFTLNNTLTSFSKVNSWISYNHTDFQILGNLDNILYANINGNNKFSSDILRMVGADELYTGLMSLCAKLGIHLDVIHNIHIPIKLIYKLESKQNDNLVVDDDNITNSSKGFDLETELDELLREYQNNEYDRSVNEDISYCRSTFFKKKILLKNNNKEDITYIKFFNTKNLVKYINLINLVKLKFKTILFITGLVSLDRECDYNVYFFDKKPLFNKKIKNNHDIFYIKNNVDNSIQKYTLADIFNNKNIIDQIIDHKICIVFIIKKKQNKFYPEIFRRFLDEYNNIFTSISHFCLLSNN